MTLSGPAIGADLERWSGRIDEARWQLRLDRERVALERAQASADRTRAALELQQALLYRANADHDELTGALRRGPGLERLREELERASRSGEPLAVAFVDVDGLKRVNDTLGHAAGDQLLHSVASVLQCGVRSYDVVVRWGGDEFVCVLPGTGLADAGDRLAQISAVVAEQTDGESISFGVAGVARSDSVSSLLKRADADLYQRRRQR